MFDFMIKKLPNGRLLVRDTASRTSESIKATDISSYIEKLLKEQIDAENDKLEKEASLRDKVLKGEK